MNQFKKKILHIITFSTWGGAPQVVYDIIKNSNKEKFSVDLACGIGKGWERMKELEIEIIPIKSLKRDISILNDLKALIQLYFIIKRGGYDIVHCHSTKAGFLGRLAAKLAGIPNIYFTVHGWGFYNKEEYGWAQSLFIFLEKIAAKCSIKIICVSENDKKQGIKKKIAEQSKFLVIKNGIDWKIEGDRERARKKLGIREKEIVFGMVSRLAYQKNPLMFLKAGQAVKEKIFQASLINIKLVLIGGGPLFKECQEFIKENKLENDIFLLGEKTPNETRELLHGFDVLILSSKFEGLPLTIIEAMFAGLPIIASDVGGVGEMVQNKKNGFLVKPDNLDELIEKMIYLANNPKKRKQMGQESQKITEQNFTLKRMIESYEDLYEI